MTAVSFRTPTPKIKEIDAIAISQQRDRSFILNEAIDHYLDMQAYHLELVHQGMRDANDGRVLSHEDVGRELAAHRSARKSKKAAR